MGDLISRSALIEMIDSDIDMTKRFMDKITNPLEMASRNYIALASQLNTLKSLREIIEEKPIAYDVEKVVVEIRRCSGNGYRDIDGDYVPPLIKTEKVIDIVKRGGVDGC